jgi:pyrroline-5-carboxylate reductase
MKNNFSPTCPLVLVGCGRMGHAMAVGWLRAGLDPNALYIVDPDAPSLDTATLPGVPDSNLMIALGMLDKTLDIRAIILAVKPQIMEGILALLAPLVGPRTLVISIAAGVTLGQMARALGTKALLVRAMPNTPAAVGAGITGITARADMDDTDKQLAHFLLGATGATVWIEDESLMNMVTAVSGSGPAYVFHMVECMAAAGVRGGLGEETAMQLARQTLIGAARLMAVEADVPAAELRRRVTSPGGTTAAALDVLMAKDGLADLMVQAIEAARRRGEDLAG